MQTRFVVFLLTAVSSFLAQSHAPKTSADARLSIVGVWRGNSACMVKDSPCHDETNVYRISAVAGKPGLMTVTGSKIVGGQEIVMGSSSDWKYDPQSGTLDSANGAIHFVIDGNKMEGELRLPDGTLYRRIHLKRDESAADSSLLTNPLIKWRHRG